MKFRFLAVLVLLLVTLVFSSLAATPADYAGQYILQLGTRNFLVLNLKNTQGRISGTLARPLHSSLGSVFSNISKETIVQPIASAVIQQDHLHFIANNPKDPSDTDEFDFFLLPPGHATLHLSGAPVDPWMLTRVSLVPPLSVATDWDPQHTYYPDETKQSNPEMQHIWDEDQKPRQSINMFKGDWNTIDKQDAERRKQVYELLSHGALHTGKDYEQAAIIFQHGSTPDDYLLAHTLAMIAIARGNPGALGMATMTLDRYLNSIKQSQIYGTQFYNPQGTSWTQEPYNRTLISDELRKQLGVPSQATQQKQLENYKSANQH